MDVLSLVKALIQRASVTPDDAGCQDMIADLLSSAGFVVHDLSTPTVKNLYASHGEGQPLFIFVGHTDVVTPGALASWNSDPFVPTIRNGYLYGRGAADMKGALAAMLVGACQYVQAHPNHPGTVAFVMTSDEEGPAVDGTVKVVEFLRQQHLVPQYVLVGEASSRQRLGDAIKIGRRGSLQGILTIHGQQGHIAYPEKAKNPIHYSLEPLNALVKAVWDEGDAYFPATALQFFEIQAGVGAANVIPGQLIAKFNMRFAPKSTLADIQHRFATILEEYDVSYTVDWHVSSQPYFSGPCTLSRFAQEVIDEHLGVMPELDALGGTSDGRHFAPGGAQVVELGVVNASIHQANECVRVEDLYQLTLIYQAILERAINHSD